MKSSIYILLVVNALCLDSALLEAASVADQTNAISLSPTVLTALFDEARTNNTSLRVAEARVTTSRLGIATVRQWEDPKFTFGVAVASPRGFKESEEGNLIYGVEQKLPLWNRPRLSRDIAVAETQTQASEAAFREAQLDQFL